MNKGVPINNYTCKVTFMHAIQRMVANYINVNVLTIANKN